MTQTRLTRAEQQARTRARLLAAAEELLVRQGYGATSLDLVAETAGYSKGAIYSNFASKEALFLALLQGYMQRLHADLEALIASPALIAGQAGLSDWLQALPVDENCLRLTTELQLQARRNPAFAADFYALQQNHFTALTTIIRRLVGPAADRMPIPPETLARVVLALAHGLGLQAPANGGAAPASDTGALIAAVLSLALPQRS
ncbi:MAG: TetR/AcrR family transcriptional regulator [Tabrizicola sp.]|nr:TetR/AcrR family transcriptional regulator [Tabrizicola sp.]